MSTVKCYLYFVFVSQSHHHILGGAASLMAGHIRMRSFRFFLILVALRIVQNSHLSNLLIIRHLSFITCANIL